MCTKKCRISAVRTAPKAIVIGGEKAMAAAKEDLLAGVAGSDIEITGFLKYGDDVTYEAADALCANPDVQAADMIFAVGGGRATDTCKTAADKLDKPIFTFPTIASNCAAVTLVCVMHKPDRSLAGFHYRKEPAKHAFINLDIISKAPLEYIWAGIGDAFSKAYEPSFSAMNDELDHSNMIGVDLAKHCGEPAVQICCAGLRGLQEPAHQRSAEADCPEHHHHWRHHQHPHRDGEIQRRHSTLHFLRQHADPRPASRTTCTARSSPTPACRS